VEEVMKKPSIVAHEINGVGSHGYLSVRKGSYSESVLKKMVAKGIAKKRSDASFKCGAYCVEFPSHFRDFVEVEGNF
jgi:uncharacterized protein YjaZ